MKTPHTSWAPHVLVNCTLFDLRASPRSAVKDRTIKRVEVVWQARVEPIKLWEETLTTELPTQDIIEWSKSGQKDNYSYRWIFTSGKKEVARRMEGNRVHHPCICSIVLNQHFASNVPYLNPSSVYPNMCHNTGVCIQDWRKLQQPYESSSLEKLNYYIYICKTTLLTGLTADKG